MPHLILVRHAPSRPLPDRPARDWPLAAPGLPGRLAHIVRPFRPNPILSSSEVKAVATATRLAEALGVPYGGARATLDEHDRHGVPYFAAEADFLAAVERFFAVPDAVVLGRESADSARARFRAGVAAVLADFPGASPLLVTHGTVMALFAAPALGQPPVAVWRTIQRLGMPLVLVLTLPDLALVTLQGMADGVD